MRMVSKNLFCVIQNAMNFRKIRKPPLNVRIRLTFWNWLRLRISEKLFILSKLQARRLSLLYMGDELRFMWFKSDVEQRLEILESAVFCREIVFIIAFGFIIFSIGNSTSQNVTPAVIDYWLALLLWLFSFFGFRLCMYKNTAGF